MIKITVFLKEFLIKNRYRIIFLFFIQFFYTILGLIFPYLNGKFLDVLISSKYFKDILFYVCIFALIGISNILLGYAYNLLLVKSKSDLSFLLNLSVINIINKLYFEEFDEFNPTYLHKRISEDTDVIIGFWIENFFSILLNTFSLSIVFFIIYSINKYIFIVAVFFCIVYSVIYYIFRKPIYNLNRDLIEESNSFFDDVNRIYLKNKYIRIGSFYSNVEKFIEGKYQSYLFRLVRFSKLSLSFSSIDDMVSLSFQVFIFLFGGYYVINNMITIGEFSFISIYYGMVMSLIKYFFSTAHSYQIAKVSFERLLEIKVSNIESNGSEKFENVENIKLIEFNYKFTYSKLYESNLNLEFSKGNIYCISGKNGGGKSTLINSIIGFYSLNKFGKILINNIDIENVDKYVFRKYNVSYMMEGNFFEIEHMNIDDKINLSIEEYRLYCNLFKSEIFNIDKIKNKDIENLSSGEKQLLAINNCILKNVDIYIFDEPTSNLNSVLIKPLMDYLEYLSKNSIVIVVTHDEIVINSTINTICIG